MKRHLTPKQKEAGFGGKRNMHPYAKKHTHKKHVTYAHAKRKTSSPKTPKSSGRPSWVPAAVWAAVAAVAAAAGVAINSWVQDRGGWSYVKTIYDTQGVTGVLTWVMSGGRPQAIAPAPLPVAPQPVTLAPPAPIRVIYPGGSPGGPPHVSYGPPAPGLNGGGWGNIPVIDPGLLDSAGNPIGIAEAKDIFNAETDQNGVLSDAAGQDLSGMLAPGVDWSGNPI